MKDIKKTEPVQIPAEVWKAMKPDGMVWVVKLFKKWKKALIKNVVIPFPKNNGEVRNCDNFHTLLKYEKESLANIC